MEGGEESAALQVLGLGFEDLGVGVARVWGLPESLQRCMRKPRGSPMQRAPEQGVERLRWVAMAANEVASTLLASDAASLEAHLGQIGTRYSPPWRCLPQRFRRALCAPATSWWRWPRRWTCA